MLVMLSGVNDHQASRGSPLAAFGKNSGLRRRADDAARGHPVLDDERMAERFAEPGREDARDHVGRAAGACGHDQPNRPGRIALRLRLACRLRHGGIGVFNLANLVRFTTYPGPDRSPADAWPANQVVNPNLVP